MDRGLPPAPDPAVAMTAIATRWRCEAIVAIRAIVAISAVVAMATLGPMSAAGAQPAPSAQPAAPSYFAGKQINLICGAAVGGGYDALARLMARHLGRLIAGNPTVIVQN